VYRIGAHNNYFNILSLNINTPTPLPAVYCQWVPCTRQ